MFLTTYVNMLRLIDDPIVLKEIAKKADTNNTKTITDIFCDLYTDATDKDNRYDYRRMCLEAMINCYNVFKELQEEFIYCPDELAYRDRFQRREDYDKIHSLVNFDDGINYSTPPGEGLYFIGETNFNPFTGEEYYWVKIGKSTRLSDRMTQYDTHHPMLWRIDFNDDYDYENYYHHLLKKKCLNTCNHSKEWFRVDRETYLEMCAKGFDYFKEC